MALMEEILARVSRFRLIIKTQKSSDSPRIGFRTLIKTLRSRFSRVLISVLSWMVIFGIGGTMSNPVFAGFLSFIGVNTPAVYTRTSQFENSQNLAVLTAPLALNPQARGGSTIIIDDNALSLPHGPGATLDDAVEFNEFREEISTYSVQSGDTLSSIAAKFGISVSTLKGANKITGNTIAVGQTLTILPTDGVLVKVKSGETLSSIAKKYKGDAAEIADYNSIDPSHPTLTIGQELLIPGGQLPVVVAAKPKAKSSLPAGSFGFTRPIDASAGHLTQGIHGSHNGIDIGAPTGTPIHAVSDGTIVIARNSGYNGGFGRYVVQDTSAGFQSLYAHMSQVVVSSGDRVTAGQIIGYVGNTGHSTGPHVHYEERGSGKLNSMLSAY